MVGTMQIREVVMAVLVGKGTDRSNTTKKPKPAWKNLNYTDSDISSESLTLLNVVLKRSQMLRRWNANGVAGSGGKGPESINDGEIGRPTPILSLQVDPDVSLKSSSYETAEVGRNEMHRFEF
jgi:hypothetical protein